MKVSVRGQDRTGRWLLGIVLGPLLAGGLFYWGWCWGWWGRESLLLQYLFQCRCPATSEEARQPAQVDVIVSACVDPGIHPTGVSPNGRYLQVIHRSPSRQPYLYDQQTGETKADVLPGLVDFVTDELVLDIDATSRREVENYRYYLYDIDGNRLQQLNWVPMAIDHSVEPGDLDPFYTAEQVYVLPIGLAVALAPNYSEHPEANYVLGRYIYASTDMNDVIRILDEREIEYQVQVPWHYPSGRYELVSRSGLFRYYIGDINLAMNNQPITDGGKYADYYAQGWAYEDRGVILHTTDLYLIGKTGSLFVPQFTFFRVPQPILLLKVPPEYLSPAAQQAEVVRQAQEQAAKTRAAAVFWIAVGAMVAVVSLGVFWQRRQNKRTESGQG